MFFFKDLHSWAKELNGRHQLYLLTLCSQPESVPTRGLAAGNSGSRESLFKAFLTLLG
jgi:hypothetical protein